MRNNNKQYIHEFSIPSNISFGCRISVFCRKTPKLTDWDTRKIDELTLEFLPQNPL